jgi:predicted transcriptional regulator
MMHNLYKEVRIVGKKKIFDSEMYLMDKIWDEGQIKAIDLANWATETLGWKKNSTYSTVTKLIEKQVVKRTEPGFVITPLVTREEVATEETNHLIEKIFKGNMKMFLTAFVANQTFNEDDIATLKKFIENNKEN